jgi:hypothetical protein
MARTVYGPHGWVVDMNKQQPARPRLSAVAAAVGLALVLAGCTTSPAGPSTSPSPSAVADPPPRAAPTPGQTATPAKSVLEADAPTNEKIRGRLSSQSGTNELGPFKPRTSSIAVYFRCVGEGAAEVVISGVGGFPYECDASGAAPGIKNTFDARYVKNFTVSVSAHDNLVWAITVADVR